MPVGDPTQLTVAGLTLPLASTPRGPVISIDPPQTAPLAWIINLAVDGGLKDLRGHIEHGTPIHYKTLHAVPSTAEGSRIYTLSADFMPQTMTLPAETILEALAQLESLRRNESSRIPQTSLSHQHAPDVPPPESKAMYSSNLQNHRAGEHEKIAFEELERCAAEIDELASGERTVDTAALESAKRRFLLIELDAAGLLHPGRASADLLLHLREWKLFRLLEYHAAALQVSLYLASEERRAFLPDAGPARVLGAPVSVDWFRRGGSSAEGPAAFKWLAYCEYALTYSEIAGGEGEIFTKLQGGWWRLKWRTDDGIHPALVQASEVGPGLRSD